jgi:hypothetical protein
MHICPSALLLSNLGKKSSRERVVFIVCILLYFPNIYKGQSNENGSPCITHMARKLVTLEFAYGMNIWWGLGEVQ